MLDFKLSDQSNKCTRLNFHGSVTPEIKDPTALTAFLLPFTFLLNFNGKKKNTPFIMFPVFHANVQLDCKKVD